MDPHDQPPAFTQPVQIGDVVTLIVEQLGLNGDGLCRINNYVVFVPGALPGEEIEVEIVSAGRKNGRGELQSVLTPSEHRVDPRCQHFGECGGCQLQHLDYQEQLRFKTETVRKRLQHALDKEEIPVLDCLGPSEPWGHRNRVALQVTEEFGQLVAGLFQRRSRRVIPIQECPVSEPGGLQVAIDAVDAARRAGLDAWDPRTEAGTLRTVLTRTSSRGETSATIVLRNKDPREIDELCAEGFGAIGLSININRGDQQRLLGRHTEFLKGEEFTHELVRGVKFRLSPAGWFRNSHFAAQAAAKTVREFVEPIPGATVVDLYSGMGFFALTLADGVGQVIAIEENPRAIADARASIELNGIRNVQFREGAVEQVLPGVKDKIYAMIVDPPKEGCGRYTINMITKDARPERLIYVSQNPEVFAEEVAVFTQRGFNLRAVQPIDTGPHTSAMEVVALFEARIEQGKRRSSIAQARRLLKRMKDEDKKPGS